MNAHGFLYTSSRLRGFTKEVVYDFEKESQNTKVTFVLSQPELRLLVNGFAKRLVFLNPNPDRHWTNDEIVRACEHLFRESGLGH